MPSTLNTEYINKWREGKMTMSEKIITFWKVGYFKLFDEQGDFLAQKCISTESNEWHKIFWRFYWREG